MDKKLEEYAIDRSYINSQMFGIEHELLNNIESAHVDPYEDSHVDIIRDKAFIPRQPIGGDYRLEEKRLRKALVCLNKAYSINSEKCLILRKKLHSFYLATNQVGMAHELVNCPSIHIFKLEHIFGKDDNTSETKTVSDGLCRSVIVELKGIDGLLYLLEDVVLSDPIERTSIVERFDSPEKSELHEEILYLNADEEK